MRELGHSLSVVGDIARKRRDPSEHQENESHRRNFAGDWDLKTEQKYERVDASKVKFVLPLKPREKQKFTYELTTRYGINVTR